MIVAPWVTNQFNLLLRLYGFKDCEIFKSTLYNCNTIILVSGSLCWYDLFLNNQSMTTMWCVMF